MRFAILCVEMTKTLGMITARVRYVTSGSFNSHRARLNDVINHVYRKSTILLPVPENREISLFKLKFQPLKFTSSAFFVFQLTF